MARLYRMPHPFRVAPWLPSYFAAGALSMILLMTFVLAGPARADQGDQRSARRIVLFGAHWCAPCMVEYRDLSALVSAAEPDRLVLAWVDEPVPVPGQLAGRVDAVSAREARGLADRLLGEGYGLPSAVVLDPAGRACAVWKAPLHGSEVRALRDRCAAATP